MIINIFLENDLSMDEIVQCINEKSYFLSSNNLLWCEKFYIKLLRSKTIEINVFDKGISDEDILDGVLGKFLQRQNESFVIIQKGDYVKNFFYEKCGSYI